MSVIWSGRAERSLEAYLDYLEEAAPHIRPIAQTAIRGETDRLADRPTAGRPSRWPGLRELSLTRWRKIVVFREAADGVRIIAFFDTRQNLPPNLPEED